VLITDLRPEVITAARAVRAAVASTVERIDVGTMIDKGKLDITTGTDLKSQAIIQGILELAHPGIAFVGEEAGKDGLPDRRSYWLVDPICGTRNFASRLPLYCVNVALVEDGSVVLAAVGDAALGDVWVAQQGRGAWSEEAGLLSRVVASTASQTVVLDPGRPGGGATEKAAVVTAALIRAGKHELRTFGTSLDLAYLAAGRVAAVWHFSRIAPLHFAAGTLLAQEAGAVVTDDRGAGWTIRSDSLVAAADPALHHELLQLQMVRVSTEARRAQHT
jgi:myo-inositol-1(or 4)-monophosphatase